MTTSFEKALAYYRQGDYLSTIRLLTLRTPEEPNNTAEMELLGASYFKSGELAKAGRIFQELIHRNPASKQLHNTLGAIYKDEQKYDDALQEFRAAINIDANYLPALINCAATHQLAGDASEALTFFRKALALDGANVVVLRQIAELYYDNHDYHSATMHLERLETLRKLSESDVAKLAWCFFHTHQVSRAINLLSAHIESNPSHDYLKRQLAIITLNADQLDLSQRILDEILEKSPDDVEALINKGYIEHKRGKFDKALRFYQKALSLEPNNIEALNNGGVTYQELGEKDQAYACFEKILQIDPNNVNALLERGNRFNDAGEQDRAIECCNKILQIDPNNVTAYYNRGVSLHEKGNYEEAAKSCIEAIHRQPNHDDAKYNLGINLLALGQFSEAWRYYFRRDRFLDSPTEFSTITPGQNFFGKRLLFVRSQGLGDELFFLRFLPQIKAQGAWIAYRPGEKLKSIAARMPFIDRVIEIGDTFTEYDYCFSIDDLPLIVNMTSEKHIPPPLYLSPIESNSTRLEKILDAKPEIPLIGITWRAGSNSKRVSKKSLQQTLIKSIDLAQFAKALENIKGRFVILQRNPTPQEISFLREIFGEKIIDFSDANDDLEMMFSLLADIDLYIGVSNTNTHLRAMTGKIAHVFVPFPPEWRWYPTGKYSPWFPDFPVYRQKASGEWDLAELIADISKLEIFAGSIQ